MKLLQLLNGIDAKIIGKSSRNITHLSHIAGECSKDSIFFCLKGKQTDGQKYIEEAEHGGCRVIVTEEAIENKHITQIIVADSRKAMSQIAANFYDNPASKLKIIGVTGTNGKTTVCHMVKHVLQTKNTVGIIGTNGAEFCGKKIVTNMTTPDPIILHKILAQMANSGVQIVVMEMSAHAIFLQKLWGVMPHRIAFTNLSQDHLDYFENMDKYFEAKAAVFAGQKYDKSVVCIDTEYGDKIAQLSKNVLTCSSEAKNADIIAKNNRHTIFGQSFDCLCGAETQNFKINLFGKFNLQNAIVAITICKAYGIALENIAASLETFEGVDGRFDCMTYGSTKIIVDYAHTPDGLDSLLATTRELEPKEKLVCVFGCGGNRDASKRPLMAAVAEKYADFVIVTTDNPRYEDNYKIAQDIVAGFLKKKYKVLLDRGQAIREAIDITKKGGIVVIAGKGAETQMEIGGTKLEFNDKKFVKKLFE